MWGNMAANSKNFDVYFAHNMVTYNTKQEKEAHDFLGTMFRFVLCPNRDMDLGDDMRKYCKLVKKCQMVVCIEYKGHIGKGVYTEIDTALTNQIPVLVIRKDRLYHVSGIRVVNEDDWKKKYAKLIIRKHVWRCE
jgi:hypothetical protein